MTHIDKPVSTLEYECNRDMSAAPTGRKLIGINPGGVACFAIITNNNRDDFIAWAALPVLPKLNQGNSIL